VEGEKRNTLVATMMLAFAALVAAALHPAQPVASLSLGQKIEIIKGGNKKAKARAELAPQTVVDTSSANQANQARAAELDRKAADLDARHKDLTQREQALDEKEQAAAAHEKEKADKRKAQQKHIEQIGQQNEATLGAAADALAGE